MCTALPGLFVHWQANIQATKSSVDFSGMPTKSKQDLITKSASSRQSATCNASTVMQMVDRAWLSSGLLDKE